MEPFRTDGHLTDETLAALARGRALAELTRLEAAVHPALCDACLQRYTDLLATSPLLVPAHPCRDILWVRVRRLTLRLVTSRYATAAAAVALALTVVWGSGRLDFVRLPIPPEDRPSVSEGLQRWSARWSDSLDSAMSGFNDFFSGLGRWTPPPQGGN